MDHHGGVAFSIVGSIREGPGRWIVPPKMPIEDGAVLTGPLRRGVVLDRAAELIRFQGGVCNSVSRAEAENRNKVRIVCDRGEFAYDLVRRGKGWELAAPSDGRRPRP